MVGDCGTKMGKSTSQNPSNVKLQETLKLQEALKQPLLQRYSKRDKTHTAPVFRNGTSDRHKAPALPPSSHVASQHLVGSSRGCRSPCWAGLCVWEGQRGSGQQQSLPVPGPREHHQQLPRPLLPKHAHRRVLRTCSGGRTPLSQSPFCRLLPDAEQGNSCTSWSKPTSFSLLDFSFP